MPLLSKFLIPIFFLFVSIHGRLNATNCVSPHSFENVVIDSVVSNEITPEVYQAPKINKVKLITLLQKATVENKKVTAAVLTLTLGMLGVHRIYLGTAPYIPAVYLFTFGGGFFILPIIDLVMILTTNDISKFENNNKLLMWTGE